MTRISNDNQPATRRELQDVKTDLKGDIAVLREEARLKDERDQKNFDEMKKDLGKMMNHIVFLVGAYKKFDEEHTILSHRVSKHSDKIEKLEKHVFGIN